MNNDRARKVLGVGEGATSEEVFRAFRARAAAVHHDRASDPAVLALLVLAFETLQHVGGRLPAGGTRHGGTAA